MSKQILIGYKDKAGKSAAQILCGLETKYSDVAAILNAADQEHTFPEGIERIELLNCEVSRTSVFISAEVAAHLKASRENEAAATKQKAEKKAAESAQAKAIKETGEALKKAVIVRNNLLGKKHQAEVKLRNLIATPDDLTSRNHGKLIDDAKSEIEKLTTEVASAVENFQAAEKAHAEAKK